MATLRKASLPYDHLAIEHKWQQRWEADGLYRTLDDDPRPKWYALTMFPYPSGDLHIGHWFMYTAPDAYARYMRMRGYNVLFPMGFDAFGLPAENAAIRNQTPPGEWTYANIQRMRRQFRSMGTVIDWEREVVTCDPSYYRWNQWLFLKLFEAGLAYRAKAPVNWCPGCQTVLANEQVLNGKCERSGDPVERREMEQWFFKITAYADQLLDFSGLIDWPEPIKLMQTNWIGRSQGVEISFDISEYNLDATEIPTFTTRIDTVFGVTFLALAPEHPLVSQLAAPDRRAEVEAYAAAARRRTEIERLSTEREKTGVFTGAYAVNRLNGDRIPILAADYVLLSYGSGAVMGVPAHDERDFELAAKYGLDVRVVVAPPDWSPGAALTAAYVDKQGTQVNSGEFDDLPAREGYEAIADKLEREGWGKRTISYRMRDWLISRQRYWGAPIPILYCADCGIVPVPEEDLPVLLPEGVHFLPTGESPLKRHDAFVNAPCPACGGPARRETDTMDTFVDSSWYFLRYLSPHHDGAPVCESHARKWLPVDQYMGGAEHAVMHLLYSRFFTKALRDLGIVELDEPFPRLFNQGMILSGHAKMSKSRGNVIAPDDYVRRFSADVVRLYLMFIGPWEQGGDWSDSGINGVARWASRLWELCQRNPSALPAQGVGDAALTRKTHQTIRRALADIERFKMNTCISALMELTNDLSRAYDDRAASQEAWRGAVENLLLLLAPLAPHLAEELWERTGRTYSVHQQPLPQWDSALAAEEEVTLIVQVNGRLRDRINVPAGVSDADAKQAALDSERLHPHLEGREVARILYVPDRHLVNIVLR